MHHQTWLSDGMPDAWYLETLRDLSAGSGGEIQLADAINIHAKQGSVETVRLRDVRLRIGG